MKRTVIIITIIIFMLGLVGAAWIYTMFFGTPQNPDEVFANLGFAPSQSVVVTPPEVETDTGTRLAIRDGVALQQLTTRPVAGMTFVDSSTARYVEKGTGHIYDIDLRSGSEERVSGTTIPRVVWASFSPAGEAVVLISETDTARTVVASEIFVGGEEGLRGVNLPDGARGMRFSNFYSEDNKTIFFIAPIQNETAAFALDIENNTQSRLFTIPLQDVDVDWGPTTEDGEVFITTRPTAETRGYRYVVENGGLVRHGGGERGFVSAVGEEFALEGLVRDGEMVGEAMRLDTRARFGAGVMQLPQKCVFDSVNTARAWCAAPFVLPNATLPDDWYKGTVTLQDSLWEMDISRGEAILRSDFFDVSGRVIDVADIAMDDIGRRILLVNKIDGALWLFDTTVR